MNKLLFIAIVLLSSKLTVAQSTVLLEQYAYLSSGQAGTVAPQAHFTSKKNWYAEARYNYEEVNTFSLYGGKTFTTGNALEAEFTPMLGAMVGNMNGGSLGLNLDLSYRKFYFSSQSQYSVSSDNRNDNFFFSWSELGYQPADWIFTGLSLQHTQLYRTTALVEPGLMLGFTYKQWTLPLYAFKPGSNERFFVVGLNFEWQHRKKKRNASEFLTMEQTPPQ